MQGLDRFVDHSLSTLFPIIHNQSLIQPGWANLIETFALIVVIIFLLSSSKKITPGKFFLFILLILALVGGNLFLLFQHNIWLHLSLPITLLITGFAFIAIRHYSVSRFSDDQFKKDSAEKNYTIGLAFQQQGHLDWAFEKFKACPHNPQRMKALYQLAQSYEHEQHYKKAISVYQYMTEHDSDYQDIKNRIENARQQIKASFSTQEKTQDRTGKKQNLLPDAILGHYKVRKEIGRGATGTVYLGHDLRTGDKVAIKTLPLANEFDESEVEAVKHRFFREAETAGQLNHPNIVSIYDAGEVDGLAYIAMELLSGHDLTRYTRKDSLLSPVMVMGIVYKAARAIHYAHSRQVIHRDIKPANIMFDLEKKKIILTDFGIARLIDASRTRTGIILGTPAYMSPEQLEGSKIDGRSDLFALGVMLFQLLTGELPFKGESLAMLMYMISSEPHREIFKIRPELAQHYPDLAAIIDKALEKEVGDRFQTGYEMAEALKQCAKK